MRGVQKLLFCAIVLKWESGDGSIRKVILEAFIFCLLLFSSEGSAFGFVHCKPRLLHLSFSFLIALIEESGTFAS